VKSLVLSLVLVLTTCAIGAAQDTPKAEVFLGFTYSRFNSATNVPSFSANGGGGQFVVNFGKWFGAVADVGSVHNGNIGGYHLDTTMTNFMFGPRIPIRISHRVTPYFQALWGGVAGSTSYPVGVPAGTVILPPTVTPVNATAATNASNAVALRVGSQQTGFAQAYGGGLDITINRHLTFRPIGLDYYMTRLQNLRSANDNNQNNLRYTTGFSFTFGGEAPAPPPPPPPPRTCWNGTSVPFDAECPKREMNLRLDKGLTEICPGASVTVTASGEVPDSANLAWAVNGQPTSKGRSFEFGATGRDAGVYVISLSADAPEYNNAAAEARVNVLGYRAPAGRLQVSPPEIWVGDQATLAATFVPGQCSGDVGSPRFSASEGAVRGTVFDSSAVQFDASDNSEQRKTVTLYAKAADQKGEVAAEAAVVVKKKAVILAKRLPDIVFPANNARVNNCGKRVLLEELKSFIDRDPTGKVVFVGHITEKEKAELDQTRAMNAAAVISAGQGICGSFPASQILVSNAGAAENGVDLQPHFCGTSADPKVAELSGQAVKETDTQAKYRRVEVWFVPTGGVVPASLKASQDASTLPMSSIGCPK